LRALLLFPFVLACTPDDSGTLAVEPGALAPSLTVLDGVFPLTELAREAVDMSPAWLQQELALSLKQLDDTSQNDLAAVIVDASEPWLIDELAFSIAHTSPEVLMDDDFHPQLLTVNAELIYARDADLAYVELVEVGDQESGDWYTTTAYQVAVGGEVETREIDRDTYYWYVVHPRIEDEHPFYIDGFRSCMSSSLECAKDPESGWFWRDFLWDAAEENCSLDYCPALRDHIQDATVLWDEEDPSTSDGAIASIMSFMLHSDDEYGRWLSFGAGSERSIQPNRIYGLGAGNCGEWADMTTALSRTALIPNLNVTPSSWDHTWNAFYAPGSDNWTSEWIPWEPVNWWLVYGYGSTYATYATRGDALTWYQSSDYTDTFDMELVVTDANGDPVDGAYATVWSEYGESWWFAGESHTGSDGVVSFPLGAEKAYAIQVGSPQGYHPSVDYITYGSDGIAAGETDRIEIQLEGTLPEQAWSEISLEGEATVSLELDVAKAVIVSQSWRFGESFTLETEPPALDAFLVDTDNLEKLEAGEAFEGAPVLGATGELTVPTDGSWTLVLPNLSTNSVAQLGTLGVSLSLGGHTVEEAVPFELLAGDHLAVDLHFP